MSGESVRDFAFQIDAEWAAMQDDAREAVIEVATEALAGVVEKSPIDTGQFQNNWLVSIGTPDGRKVDLPGSFAGDNAGTLAAYVAAEGFPTVYVQNNLAYAARLENGYSKQAPSGMVGLTVAELEAKFDGRDV